MTTMDDDDRKIMTNLFQAVAGQCLVNDMWRGTWRVEVDGCVFKFKIDGYPKRGTPRWRKREAELAQALKEFETKERST